MAEAMRCEPDNPGTADRPPAQSAPTQTQEPLTQPLPTTPQTTDSRPLSLGRDDHPDALAAAIRDSLHTIEAFIEDRASAATRSNIYPIDIDIFWAPLSARIAGLVTSWNGASARILQPHLKVAASAPCERPHNPPCTREHTKPPAPSNTPSPSWTPPTSLTPFPAKTFAAIAAQKTITREHLDAANDIRMKVANIPADTALRMATASAPRATPSKPKPRSMPKGANKTIYLNLHRFSPEERGQLPTAGALADEFNERLKHGAEAIIEEWCVSQHGSYMSDDETACRGTHHFGIPSLTHVELLPATVRFVFDEPIPHDDAHVELAEFLTDFCKDILQSFANKINKAASNQIAAETFHFKSTVVFTNVLPLDSTGKKIANDDFLTILQDSPSWEGITITRAHFWQPPSNGPDSAGCLFVDFHDDKHSSVRRRITRLRTRIGPDFASCRETKPASKPRTAPQCGTCLRWGHLAARCTSRFNNCAICAGAHRENVHATAAPAAPRKCFNCGSDHRADSTECKFSEKRGDHKWIFDNAPKYDRVKGTWTYYTSRKGGEARTTSIA
ncbi:hypothetical protein C8Q72DRAFT_953676 [Fomitopsis betulina]|nr:hypothetical protein C8Q72DRAFT_953676 [Fomitopsis betulina]